MSTSPKHSDGLSRPPVVYRGPKGTFRISSGDEPPRIAVDLTETPAYIPAPPRVPVLAKPRQESVSTPGNLEPSGSDWVRTTSANLPAAIDQARTFQSGDRIAGTDVIEWVDEGGFAEIYRARDVASGEEVALKVLQRRHAHKVEVATRMQMEARFLADLAAHEAKNVVRILRVATVEGIGLVIVMELLRGRPLRYLMQGRKVALDEALVILVELAEAISQIHDRAIFHRDLKPENVFLERTESLRLVLIDLGCGKGPGSPRTTEEIQTVGSPPYMSPEQVSGGHLTERSDQYSFGVIAFELLEGAHIHRRREERQPGASLLIKAGWHLYADVPVPERIPSCVWPILERMLRREAEHRFASMVEVAAALRGLLARFVEGKLGPAELTPPLDPRTPSGPRAIVTEGRVESSLPKMIPRRVPPEEKIDVPSLFVLAGPPALLGLRFAIGRELVIGRRIPPLGSTEPFLTLDAETVSQTHLRMSAVFADFGAVTYGVHDMNSRNGVAISHAVVKEGLARPGNTITVGEVMLLVLGVGEVAPNLELQHDASARQPPALEDTGSTSRARVSDPVRARDMRFNIAAGFVILIAMIAIALLFRQLLLRVPATGQQRFESDVTRCA